MPRLLCDERVCSTCQIAKSLDEFYVKSYRCKDCAREYSRAYHHRRKTDQKWQDGRRNRFYKMTYGITLEERDALLMQQQGQCKICYTPLQNTGTHTHVDHDHKTGEVRGILCTNCNRGLGHFKDDYMLLEAAARYLLRFAE